MTAASGTAAIKNGDRYTSYDVGMCLQWVREKCWEVGSFYPSAIDAWNGAKFKHPGDRNPPDGAPCYYRGGTYGHIVIHRKHDSGQIRSTDCTSATHVSNAALSWPETAWGDDYLGWTEDLNGVRLPLDTGTDDNTGDDDMPEYDHAHTATEQKLTDEWSLIHWDKVIAGDAFHAGDPGADLGGHKYAAVVNVAVDAPKGAVVRIEPIEWTSADGAVETDQQANLSTTSGWIRGSVAHSGVVGDGRRLRWRISCTKKATLKTADVAILSWKK